MRRIMSRTELADKFKQPLPRGDAGRASAKENESVGAFPRKVLVETVWNIPVQFLNDPLIL
jgi:hypothetical protein